MTHRLTIPTTPGSAIHELDHRRSDGIDVRLLWNSGTNHISINVADGRGGESFAFEVAPADAVDAFHHPYAYASRGALAGSQPAEEGPLDPVADTDDGSALRRMIGRVRSAWAEMDYAQRRLLEIQTGVLMGAARKRR
jgi:hypothetical protein